MEAEAKAKRAKILETKTDPVVFLITYYPKVYNTLVHNHSFRTLRTLLSPQTAASLGWVSASFFHTDSTSCSVRGRPRSTSNAQRLAKASLRLRDISAAKARISPTPWVGNGNTRAAGLLGRFRREGVAAREERRTSGGGPVRRRPVERADGVVGENGDVATAADVARGAAVGSPVEHGGASVVATPPRGRRDAGVVGEAGGAVGICCCDGEGEGEGEEELRTQGWRGEWVVKWWGQKVCVASGGGAVFRRCAGKDIAWVGWSVVDGTGNGGSLVTEDGWCVVGWVGRGM